jgi:death-on-curing protein
MLPPTFLTTEDVIDIHRDQIDRYGGTGGIRDLGLLDSAVHVPRGTTGGEYLLPNLFEMAGAMMYSLIQNHAFIDGNKRVGVAAALVFLSINGVEIRQDDDALYRLAIAVATGVAWRGEIADYFKSRAEPAAPSTC